MSPVRRPAPSRVVSARRGRGARRSARGAPPAPSSPTRAKPRASSPRCARRRARYDFSGVVARHLASATARAGRPASTVAGVDGAHRGRGRRRRHRDRRRPPHLLRDRLGWTGALVEPGRERRCPSPATAGSCPCGVPARSRVGRPPWSWRRGADGTAAQRLYRRRRHRPPARAARCSTPTARCSGRSSSSTSTSATATRPDVGDAPRGVDAREGEGVRRRCPTATAAPSHAVGLRAGDAFAAPRRRAPLLQRRRVHRVGVRAAGRSRLGRDPEGGTDVAAGGHAHPPLPRAER